MGGVRGRRERGDDVNTILLCVSLKTIQSKSKKNECLNIIFERLFGFLLVFVCHMDLGLFVLPARKASCTRLELWGLSSLDPVGLVLLLGLIFSVSLVLF